MQMNTSRFITTEIKIKRECSPKEFPKDDTTAIGGNTQQSTVTGHVIRTLQDTKCVIK